MNKARQKVWRKYLASVAVLAVVFLSGYGLGSGKIDLHSSAVPANSSLPDQLDYSSVNKVYQALKDNYDGKLTTSQLLDGLKQGLAAATGDPHTEYFTPKEAKELTQEINNYEFTGIGAEISKDKVGNLQVVSPIKGSPAEKAGVRAGDLIATINGTSTSDLTVTQAVNKIRGKKGTEVTLGLVRDSQLKTITIKRDTITVPSVRWKMLKNHVGYIQITTFGNTTSELAEKAAKSLKSHGARSVILDLRGNPGGLLDAAVDVSSLWLEPGQLVLQEKRGSIVEHSYYATGNDILRGLKTVVLINSGSASASEITAAALHDNGIADLIGVKSYGKGSVQQVIILEGGAELKVTVAKWYRPNGQNIDKKGIKPNKTVKMTDNDIEQGRDPQLETAIKLLTD